MRSPLAAGLLLSTGLLAACDGGGLDATTAPLLASPPLRVVSLNPTDFAAQLETNAEGRRVLSLAGAPACGVDFHYLQYRTAGARAEPTSASGVLMAPTGGPGCSGPRPLLVYAHGTAPSRRYNLARIDDPRNEAWAESAMIAAFFAAQGYIVVAPNYAGYDTSPLPYHPYLNAEQQSQEVIDALAAARVALRDGLPAGVSDNGQLFLTGYSEGGHVAMATQRAMEARGLRVTAAAPMSGPYAMLAFADAVLTYGHGGLGGPIYYPLVLNSYQQAYGDLYASLSEVYSPTYAGGMEGLLPGPYDYASIYSSGKLPLFALFNRETPGSGPEPGTGDPALDAALRAPDPAADPIAALSFGDPYLFNNSFRIAYGRDALATPDGAVPTPTSLLPPAAEPASPLRRALKKNDLRGWTPMAPVMLCGGMNDPDVLYPVNTLTMKSLWAAQEASGLVSVLDVDPTSHGDAAAAGQVARIVGTIAAGVYAGEMGAAPSQIAADVQAAVASHGPFSAYFDGAGQPVSPQGVMVLGLAGVAAEAVQSSLAGGMIAPSALGEDVGFAVMANYHWPLVQSACEVAARAYFARFAGPGGH